MNVDGYYLFDKQIWNEFYLMNEISEKKYQNIEFRLRLL